MIQPQDEEDELIEKEFQRIRGAVVPSSPGAGRGPVEYPVSERSMRSDDFEYEDQQAAPSKLIKKMGKQPELYNPNDEDFIANVRKPMKPKTKQEYLQQIKAKPSQEAKRRPQPQTTAVRPDNARHLAPAKQPSLDKDFIMQGQMGETFFKQINETIQDGDLSQKQPRNQNLSNADLATVGKLEEINVELASRPFSGGQRRRRANQKRRILRADQRNMLVKDESEEAATRRRQREQQDRKSVV